MSETDFTASELEELGRAFGITARFHLCGPRDLRQFAVFAMKQEEIEIELQRRKRPEQSMRRKVEKE